MGEESRTWKGPPSSLAGMLWFAGWLFTIGFAKLVWWKMLLALVRLGRLTGPPRTRRISGPGVAAPLFGGAPMTIFSDRQEAGRLLAPMLEGYRDDSPIVLALPRGGVPVGHEIARALDAPLDVLVVRKLGAPGFSEFGLGAIAEGGAVFVDRATAQTLGVTPRQISDVAEREAAEIDRRVRQYRGGRPPPDVRGRTVILVDDGIATGGSVKAAIRALRALEPKRLVLAAPVVAAETAAELRADVDDLVVFETPEFFYSVGEWYRDFEQVSDEEVVSWLEKARRPPTRPQPVRVPTDPPGAVVIPVEAGDLAGTLEVPHGASGIVIFAHGSGSSRLSPRNRFVARTLRGAGFATLLMDLLTPDEEAEDEVTGGLRFDVGLLAERLAEVTAWVRRASRIGALPVGFFGASTGAAAALIAAATDPGIRAVVSRGGRPDLAGPALARMRAPTLLIVGGDDDDVLVLNRQALARLRCEARLAVVPDATHLFEEPGALEVVARLACAWFARHLTGRSAAMPVEQGEAR
jgi:putative phosphoribosyl transferase